MGYESNQLNPRLVDAECNPLPVRKWERRVGKLHAELRVQYGPEKNYNLSELVFFSIGGVFDRCASQVGKRGNIQSS